MGSRLHTRRCRPSVLCAVLALPSAPTTAETAALSREISPSCRGRVQPQIRDSEYHVTWQEKTYLVTGGC